jgi:hypothetical protein
MSQVLSASSVELLLIAGRGIALLAGFFTLAWAFSQWRKAAISDTQRVFDQLDLVRADLLIMKESMNHSTHRNDRYQNDRYQDEPRLPPVSSAMSNARGYEIAVRMARTGAHKEELMRSCGITSHEAELLIKLHRRSHAAAAPQSKADLGDRAADRGPDRARERSFETELEGAHLRSNLAKEPPPKARAAKSRLMAIG